MAVTLATRSAATQTDPAGSTDGSGSAPTPPKPSTGISVSFADTAASLPQDDIRTAVARELDHQPSGGALVTGELNVALENEHIIVRFRGTQGYTERVLPLPEERAQIPVMLGLLAGNLARDQRAALQPEPPPPILNPFPETPPKKPPSPPPPRYSRHFLGVHLAQDFMFLGGDNVCDPTRGQVEDNYACFYSGTSNTFYNTPNPTTDSVPTTLVAATTRVLLSYDYATSPRFTVGLRLGYAFRGGPAAGQQPGVPNSGTDFFPGHAEARVSYWLLPLTNEPWHAFVGLGGGIAQVDARVSHSVIDCEQMEFEHPGDGVGETSQACRDGKPIDGQTYTELDAWKKTGQAFGAVHAGAMLDLVDDLSATVDLGILYLFPGNGVSFQPSLGIVYAP